MFGIESENFDHRFADEFEVEPIAFKEFRSLTPSEFDQIEDHLFDLYGIDPVHSLIDSWGLQISFTIGDAKTKEMLTYAAKQCYAFDYALFKLETDAPKDSTKLFDIARGLRRKWQSIFLEAYAKRVKELGFDKQPKKRSKAKTSPSISKYWTRGIN